MKPKWLLQTDIFDENLDRFVSEIKKQDMEVKVVKYIPFEGGSYKDLFEPDDCVIFYGSLQFANQIRKTCSWVPGVYCTMKNYECTNYYPKLGKYLLAEDYCMVPFGDLVRQSEFLFQTFGGGIDTVFIRPNSGNKIFTGQLFYAESLEKELEILSNNIITPDELVVVSWPRRISHEWRFVVADKEVVAGSQYKCYDKHVTDKFYPVEAFDLAQKAAESDYEPDKVWCVDICQVGEWYYVLEVGGFSCAGLYECDLEAVASRVSDAAKREWEEYIK